MQGSSNLSRKWISFCQISSAWLERNVYTVDVVGSNPSSGTTNLRLDDLIYHTTVKLNAPIAQRLVQTVYTRPDSDKVVIAVRIRVGVPF